jgi:mono/diheme cytochrome c family protein/plastocyanin
MTDTPERDPQSDAVQPPAPSGGPETRLPARRPSAEPAPVDRFSSPPQARRFELTPERAASIVRQSSSARWIGFLSVVVVVLFVIIYYFYELGLPGGLSQARLGAELEHQQVVAVERGYNLYQANCARCHGVNGEGGIGPVLNDQMKLYQHLSEEYLQNVLEVGGRYVCGNADSVMPVWSDQNGGPLNYRQIEELIAFLRAPSDQEFEIRDATLNEPTGRTFRGWRDPNFQPPPEATPFPDCWSRPEGSPSTAPSASLPADAEVLEVTASQIAFDVKELTAPADTTFGIHFVQQDSGVGGHDIDIRSSDDQTVVDNPVIADPGETTYVISGLEPGSYTFICSVHPIPAMTGTLTVE